MLQFGMSCCYEGEGRTTERKNWRTNNRKYPWFQKRKCRDKNIRYILTDARQAIHEECYLPLGSCPCIAYKRNGEYFITEAQESWTSFSDRQQYILFIGEIVTGVTLQFRHFKCPHVSVLFTPDCITRDVSAAVPRFQKHVTNCIPDPFVSV